MDKYQDLLLPMLEAIDKYCDNILMVDQGEEISYQQFFAIAKKIYAHLPKGNVLINIQKKSFYAATFLACLMKESLPFLRNAFEPNSPLDKYQFDITVDDEMVKGFLKDEVEVEFTYHPINPLSPAAVILSSGTSKDSKPIVLSHRGMITNILSGFKIYEVEPGWTFVGILPMDHAYGLTSDFVDLLLKGCKIVYSYSVLEFFTNLRNYSPNSINITLNICQAILNLLKENGKTPVVGDNLSKILVGGSKCDLNLINEFKKFDISICTSYGLTECSPCISISSPVYFKDGSDGKIFDCHQIEISDEGEIIVRGDSIMLNYYDEYLKGEVVNEIHTKDIGYIEDGFIFVIGRKDNLIVLSNGTKIQPEVFEAKLKENEGVIDAVIYMKNGRLTLDVILQKDAGFDVKKALNYLDIDINFVSEIKKNQMGKVSRKDYR